MNFVDQIKDANERVGKRSKDFDLLRRRVEQFFGGLKKFLNEAIDDTYSVKKNLFNTLAKLTSLLPLLLNANSVMKDFQEQQQLGDLVAYISTDKYRSAFARISNFINSYSFLMDYKLAYQSLDKHLSVKRATSKRQYKKSIWN